MPSNLFHLSHVHYHPDEDYAPLADFASMEEYPRILIATRRPDLAHVVSKVSKPAGRAIELAARLNYEHVLFGPAGELYLDRFETHRDAWEEGPNEYEVSGHMTYLKQTPEEAAEQFRDDISEGELVVSVRGGDSTALDVRPDGGPAKAEEFEALIDAASGTASIESD